MEELKRMTALSWWCGCTVDESRKARMFSRYMDDILRSAKPENITGILERVNKLHQNIEFTIERQENGSLPFLDMRVKQTGADVDTTWYRKPTDTGLTLFFRALAPMRYKKNTVRGTVHRVFNASSNWYAFTESITEVGSMLEKNQYPPQFYDSIIRETLNKIIEKHMKQDNRKYQDNKYQDRKYQDKKYQDNRKSRQEMDTLFYAI